MSTQPKAPRPAEDAKQEMTKTPGKDDVHEQREPNQQNEGVVSTPETDAALPERRSQR